ncbi:MAG: hypothetical protein AB1556_04385 [Bacillota bacterium]
MNGVNIVLLPEVLRQKPGNASKEAKDDTSEVVAERLARRLAETKTDLIKWMFFFWATQLLAIFGMLMLK